MNKYYNHEFGKHCAGEYNRDKKDNQGRTAYKINTNSIEGFWSQKKEIIQTWLFDVVEVQNDNNVLQLKE